MIDTEIEHFYAGASEPAPTALPFEESPSLLGSDVVTVLLTSPLATYVPPDVWDARDMLTVVLESNLTARALRFKLDNIPIEDKKKLGNLLFLIEQFQATVAQSSASLKSDASPKNAQAVVLRVMEQASSLLAAQMTPEQLRPNTETRKAVFSVFERVGKLLGRNTPAAVVADTGAAIKNLVDSGLIKPFDGQIADEPARWVDVQLAPQLDQDLSNNVYDIAAYNKSIPRFYKALVTWRNRDHPNVEKFYTKSDKN